MLTLTNTVLIGLVALTTAAVMLVWHVRSRGTWRHYVPGRAVMGLFAIIVAITTMATVSTITGPFPARPYIYAALYLILEASVLGVGLAILTTPRTRKDPTVSKYRADVPARIILDPKTRAYIYGISIPLIALLVGLGVVADGTAGLILNLVAAVLGVGTSTLAVANTPPREDA